MDSDRRDSLSFPSREWFEELLSRAGADSEIREKIGDLTGLILLEIGHTRRLLGVNAQRLELLGTPGMDDSWDVAFCGSEEAWRRLMQPFPPPHSQSLMALRVTDPHFQWEGNQLFAAQILPVLERLVELGRYTSTSSSSISADGPRVPGSVERDLSQITGKYVELSGLDQRPANIYYEEAGRGIPLILLHTAGADSRQFHELLADVEIASRWRIIAFDLPYHGRSTPPDGWWRTPYQLSAKEYAHWCVSFIKKVVGGKAVVMGCSMGAAITVYLAAHHRDSVSAAIALEAPDKSPGRLNRFLKNPQVNQSCYAPTYVYGLMCPDSPEVHRRRAWWYYSQGGYGVYEGDLRFYSLEWDAHSVAPLVDTGECPLYLLTGSYDYSASPESTKRLADLIPGARLQVMSNLGHFPMTENPDLFRSYLVPVLTELETAIPAGRKEL